LAAKKKKRGKEGGAYDELPETNVSHHEPEKRERVPCMVRKEKERHYLFFTHHKKKRKHKMPQLRERPGQKT